MASFEFIERARENPWLYGIFGIACIFLIIAGGLLWATFHNVFQAPIILHWDVYRGVDHQGEVRDAWALVALAAFLWAMNFSLSLFLASRSLFLSYLFALTAAIVSLFVLMAIGAIVYFN